MHLENQQIKNNSKQHTLTLAWANKKNDSLFSVILGSLTDTITHLQTKIPSLNTTEIEINGKSM